MNNRSRSGGSPVPEDAAPLRRFGIRVRRHWQWGRTQGFGRLVDEDQLDPLRRARTAAAKWRWRRKHGVPPGGGRPVYVVGLQRSGTNMVVRGLEASPEFEVHNENDRRLFLRYRLRSDDVVRSTVEASRHAFVLMKPLCDSHRVGDLLDGLGTTQSGRALWTYRSVDGRARSAQAKFGDVSRTVLGEIARGQRLDRWQAQRLSDTSLSLLRSFDYDELSPESASALLWYVRNALYFELGLDRRSDTMLVSYDALVADPIGTMRPICAFLGLSYTSRLVDHIDQRSVDGAPPLELDPRVRRHCDELQQRLDSAARADRHPSAD